MSPNHQPRKRARTPPGRQTRTRVWRNRSPPDFHLLEIPMCWNTVRVHQGEGWEIGKDMTNATLGLSTCSAPLPRVIPRILRRQVVCQTHIGMLHQFCLCPVSETKNGKSSYR
ncbi:neuropeptide Y receptor type 5 isoform X9 [Carettochelys insculpta]|uniref:neuropeptide Y receptor type 5 isoform X9 n=1 Tax=Carettochelys insculpta TaxID=44489 RepID=UPI003EC0133A